MSTWQERVVQQVRAAGRCVLFLDFDGTLTDFVREPRHAQLPPETRRVLKALARERKVRLFFISGRRRGDLWKRVRVQGCDYLGLFGAESVDRAPMRRSAVMQRLRTDIEARITDLPSVWVEDKGPAFVLHYQEASPSVRRQARRRLHALLRKTPAAHHFQSAHGLEIVPPDIRGKGPVVEQLLQGAALRHALPIYVGDDLSDEPAFRAARRGVTVRVGARRRTSAKYTVRTPADACAFLQQLAEALR